MLAVLTPCSALRSTTVLPSPFAPPLRSWEGCDYWQRREPGAWFNVTNDPLPEGSESPLWAFTKHRALNRLALRTKLPILSASAAGSTTDGGALALLKHDALGPHGDACVMVFNPGAAQHVTLDLSSLPAWLLGGGVTPYDFLESHASRGAQPLQEKLCH